MLLIPAMVLKDGRCEGAGVAPDGSLAAEEALRVANVWIAAGAQRLHLADGDAGLPGKRGAVEVIQALAEVHPEVPIQVAGNFRDGDDVGRYLSAGAEYAVLDAKAAGAAHFVNDLCLEYPGHILMTMEAKIAKGVAGGWSKLARHPLEEAARRFQQEGVAGIFYRATADAAGTWDVVPAIELARVLTIPVLVSAGLKSFEALVKLCTLAEDLAGAILEAGYRSEAQNFATAVKRAAAAPAAE